MFTIPCWISSVGSVGFSFYFPYVLILFLDELNIVYKSSVAPESTVG